MATIALTKLQTSERRRPPCRAWPMISRAARVNLLLCLVIALSAIDLALTLRWMTTIGMYESNPLVVYIARVTGSPLALGAFKLASVAVYAGMLFRLRHHMQAELGAWVAAIVLVSLTMRWMNYAHISTQFGAQATRLAAGDDPAWVTLN